MEQQNHSRKGGSVQITSGLYVEPMAEHGPRPAGSKAMMGEGRSVMICDESEPGSWKLALQLGPWRKIDGNTYTNKIDDAPVADSPNAEDYRKRAERAEGECREIKRKLDVIAAILRDL